MANNGFDKNNVKIALKNIKREKSKIEEEYGDQIISLKCDIDLLARSESLDYVVNGDNLYFYDSEKQKESWVVYNNGVFSNDKSIENKQLLDNIGARYKELKDALVVYDKFDIVSGKKLFNAYLEKSNFDKKARARLRKINSNLSSKSSEIFEYTGLYRIKKHNKKIPNITFGIEDVDGTITKGVFLNEESEWEPYSKSADEKDILKDYANIFNEFKENYYIYCYINRCILEKHDNTIEVKKERSRLIEKYVPNLEEERKIVK